MKKAKELDADILLGTDPDADRVGIGVKDNHGEWVLMNGNQTAVLAFNYMMEARKTKGIAQPNDMVITTIVTTGMINEIALKNGVACYNVLTGFKWIAEMIREKEGKENYVIGGEESFGLMIGDKIRDKDAVSAVALLCEMAAYEKDKGKTLFDKMIDLYIEYGFYKEHLISITKKGMDGQQQIAAMMEGYRNNPPKMINGSEVVQLLDYELSKEKNLQKGEEWPIKLAKIECSAVYSGRWQHHFGKAQRYRTKDQILFQCKYKIGLQEMNLMKWIRRWKKGSRRSLRI